MKLINSDTPLMIRIYSFAILYLAVLIVAIFQRNSLLSILLLFMGVAAFSLISYLYKSGN
jgi:hypothetical protein